MAEAAAKGRWSALFDWPLIAIHAVLMPDGRVLTYGTDRSGVQTGALIYDVWSPEQGTGASSHLTLPNGTGTDLFCSAQSLLPLTGNVLLSGGDVYNPATGAAINQGNASVSEFRPASDTLVRVGSMNRPRWYATSVTLPDGEIYFQGGLSTDENAPDANDRAEVRGVDGRFRLLDGFGTKSLLYWYPRLYLDPQGLVFGTSDGEMFRIDPKGRGSFTPLGELPVRAYGIDSTAVMFRPGRILQLGGNEAAAVVIDINHEPPEVTVLDPPSTYRRWASSTVLADGRVAVTGGSDVTPLDLPNRQALGNPSFFVDIFDPATNRFTPGAAQREARMYHSTAILLPDATVLSAGGGAPGPRTNLNAEIWRPPYLYRADGSDAKRPVIDDAPAVLEPGAAFTLAWSSAESIARVTLVRTGAVTHSFDFDQRFVELEFSRSGNHLQVRLPANTRVTPPGYYMVFILDGAGVPSIARIVRVNPSAPTPDPPPGPQVPITETVSLNGTVTGGQEYSIDCAAGEVLAGLNAFTAPDSRLTAAGVVCVRVNQAGQWVGEPVARGWAGATNATREARTCPVGSAVSGFRGTASFSVDRIDLECRALQPGGTLAGPPTPLPALGTPLPTLVGACDANLPAVGIAGRSHWSVERLSLRCGANAGP